MKLDKSIYQDAETVGVDMKQLVNLMNIVIDDFVDNGELEDRRALTVSALFVIKSHLELLADMQDEIVGRMAAGGCPYEL